MKRPPDSELPLELRAELQRSRRAGHDYDVLGKLPQLRAALDVAALPDSGSSAEHAPATPEGQLSRAPLQVASSTWKLVLLAAFGATALVAWQALVRQPTPERPSRAAQHAVPPAPAPTPATVRDVEPSPVVSPTQATAPEAPATQAVAVPAVPAASPPFAARSSRREIAQLVRIRALLERDPAAAYRAAQQSEREFPRGVLSEERQALQVLALAKSGSAEAAQRKAQEFFTRYPQSPMRDLLEAKLRE